MYEVIIVGAGPSGSSAAATLARAGRKVLLLDQVDFPRDKPCGDGISSDAALELEKLGVLSRIASADFRPICGIEYSAPNGEVLHMQLPVNPPYQNFIAPRSKFDQLLLDHAIEQGAVFQKLHVVDIVLNKDRISGVVGQVAKKRVEIEALVTIIANGANSSLASKMINTREIRRSKGVAIRAYVETEHKLDCNIRAYFLSWLLPGYAWIFPITDHSANIGLGTTATNYKRIGKKLTLLLSDFLNVPSIIDILGNDPHPYDVTGWSLNLGYSAASRVFPGALLVGDAGAFINPATGAGIETALMTGRIAGEVVANALTDINNLDQGLNEFDFLWRRKLLRQLRTAHLLQITFMTKPAYVNSFIRLIKRQPRIFRRTAIWLGKLL